MGEVIDSGEELGSHQKAKAFKRSHDGTLSGRGGIHVPH